MASLNSKQLRFAKRLKNNDVEGWPELLAALRKTREQMGESCGNDPLKWRDAYCKCLADLSALKGTIRSSRRKTKEE